MLDQALWDSLYDRVAAYLEKSRGPLTPLTSPDEVARALSTALPEEGRGMEGMLKELDQYLQGCLNTHNKRFANQLWSGITPPGVIGDLFTSVTNTSMYTYEVAPLATMMEHALIERLNQEIGFTEGDGIFTTGSSHGNLLALLLARHRYDPSGKEKGYTEPFTIFVSEDAHYSFLKAAQVLGLGADNVVKVKVDDEGRMCPSDLRDRIAHAQHRPLFIAATAGTTVRGAFDDLPSLIRVAREHGLWCHVDAAFGGYALLSSPHRPLLEGIEKADSVSWDAHKVLGLPLMCAAFFVQKKGILREACTCTGTTYIFHDEHEASLDIGPLSLQCGRKVDVLKLWLSFQYYGRRGYEQRLERLFDVAAYAEKCIQHHDTLELVLPRSSLTLCFRYVDSSITDLNAFNKALRESLLKKGVCAVNYAFYHDSFMFRYVVVHHELQKEDIDKLLHHILTEAHLLLSGNEPLC